MVRKSDFGNNSYEYVISDGDLTVSVIEYGATVKNIIYKGTDCVLGYDTLDGYINGKSHQGGTIGRYANRIENGKFTLDGVTYHLDINSGINCIHGGKSAYSHRFFKGEAIDDNSVKFSLYSKDGESGFPANLDFSVTFSVRDNTLHIEYNAVSDKNTVVNFTNHSYFTLGAENCLNTYLKIEADNFNSVDKNAIPTKISPVDNTPFDFRIMKKIGRDMFTDNEQLDICRGYDHNFILSMDRNCKKDAAVAECKETGIGVSCSTDMPGVQLYAATWLNESGGKGGKDLTQFGAFCLETQFFPNTPNEKDYPSCVLKAGEKFNSKTEYKFYSL